MVFRFMSLIFSRNPGNAYSYIVLYFSQTVEKGENFNNNTGKSEVPSEVELLQKVTADLKEEVKSLKEQMEREKKESNDVKT